MMLHSRHILCRLTTSAVRPHCFASTLVLAEQVDGGNIAPVTLNTYAFARLTFDYIDLFYIQVDCSKSIKTRC